MFLYIHQYTSSALHCPSSHLLSPSYNNFLVLNFSFSLRNIFMHPWLSISLLFLLEICIINTVYSLSFLGLSNAFLMSIKIKLWKDQSRMQIPLCIIQILKQMIELKLLLNYLLCFCPKSSNWGHLGQKASQNRAPTLIRQKHSALLLR